MHITSTCVRPQVFASDDYKTEILEFDVWDKLDVLGYDCYYLHGDDCALFYRLHARMLQTALKLKEQLNFYMIQP